MALASDQGNPARAAVMAEDVIVTSQMPGQANAEQIEYWNGEVGQRWVRRQEALDRVFAPLTAALLERATPRLGERVLDIGCGCGTTTLALAERVGAAGHVLAVDVSRPMLEHAQARAAAGGGTARAPIKWLEADASAHGFGPTVDLLFSRFGVMFFDRPVAAFANLRQGLKPGGRLVMLCWRGREENPWVAVPLGAVLQVVPPPEPMAPDAPGPFAFADAERVGRILAEAGFHEITSERYDARLAVGERHDGSDEGALEEAAGFLLEVGPVSALLKDAEAEVRGLARAGVLKALRPYARDGRVELGASCWLYRAASPAAPATTPDASGSREAAPARSPRSAPRP